VGREAKAMTDGAPERLGPMWYSYVIAIASGLLLPHETAQRDTAECSPAGSNSAMTWGVDMA